MRLIISFLLIFNTICSISQENIHYYSGSFDAALVDAKKNNKDIFFITKSESCHVFDVFTNNINQDLETVKFLNNNFIVFEFNLNKASENEIKRLKKYHHSWRGFPQIYFIDANEELISDIVYTLDYDHIENLNI